MDFLLTRILWKIMKGKHQGFLFSLHQNPQFFDIFPCHEKDFTERGRALCKHPWHKSKDTICPLEGGMTVRNVDEKRPVLHLIVDRCSPINNLNVCGLGSEDQETGLPKTFGSWREDFNTRSEVLV